MWSSIQNLIKEFPQERFIIIENGAPRFVLLSIEEYRNLLTQNGRQQERKELKHTIADDQINIALQEAVEPAEEINVSQENTGDFTISDNTQYDGKQSSFSRHHSFRSLDVSVDDLPL